MTHGVRANIFLVAAIASAVVSDAFPLYFTEAMIVGMAAALGSLVSYVLSAKASRTLAKAVTEDAEQSCETAAPADRLVTSASALDTHAALSEFITNIRLETQDSRPEPKLATEALVRVVTELQDGIVEALVNQPHVVRGDFSLWSQDVLQSAARSGVTKHLGKKDDVKRKSTGLRHTPASARKEVRKEANVWA
jgi:hypothetical protein